MFSVCSVTLRLRVKKAITLPDQNPEFDKKVFQNKNTSAQAFNCGHTEELESMENYKTFPFKSGCCRLKEVVVYERFQLKGFD